MKIIKHCSESLPTFVAGSLLGLDVENRLEVTHCVPFPSSNTDNNKDDLDPQMDILKALREVCQKASTQLFLYVSEFEIQT